VNNSSAQNNEKQNHIKIKLWGRVYYTCMSFWYHRSCKWI